MKPITKICRAVAVLLGIVIAILCLAVFFDTRI